MAEGHERPRGGPRTLYVKLVVNYGVGGLLALDRGRNAEQIAREVSLGVNPQRPRPNSIRVIDWRWRRPQLASGEGTASPACTPQQGPSALVPFKSLQAAASDLVDVFEGHCTLEELGIQPGSTFGCPSFDLRCVVDPAELPGGARPSGTPRSAGSGAARGGGGGGSGSARKRKLPGSEDGGSEDDGWGSDEDGAAVSPSAQPVPKKRRAPWDPWVRAYTKNVALFSKRLLLRVCDGPRSAPRFIKREEIAELMVDLKDSWVALLPRAVFGGALLATYKANGPLPAHIPMVELDIRSTRLFLDSRGRTKGMTPKTMFGEDLWIAPTFLKNDRPMTLKALKAPAPDGDGPLLASLLEASMTPEQRRDVEEWAAYCTGGDQAHFADADKKSADAWYDARQASLGAAGAGGARGVAAPPLQQQPAPRGAPAPAPAARRAAAAAQLDPPSPAAAGGGGRVRGLLQGRKALLKQRTGEARAALEARENAKARAAAGEGSDYVPSDDDEEGSAAELEELSAESDAAPAPRGGLRAAGGGAPKASATLRVGGRGNVLVAAAQQAGRAAAKEAAAAAGRKRASHAQQENTGWRPEHAWMG